MSSLGRIVLSRAGRDKNTYLAIIGEENGCYVLSDGKHRPIENPKHKKPKHVEVLTARLPEAFMKALLENEGVTNKMLWKAIKESLNSHT